MYARKPRHHTRMTLAMAASALAVACSVDKPTAPLGTRPASVIVASQFHVTSTLDDGSDGTLRKEIGDAADDDTVTIDAALAGQTINLSMGQITVLKRLTILGPGPQGITIRADANSRVFLIPLGGSLEVQDATVTGGDSGGDGGAFSATGPLALKRVTMTGNTSANRGGAVYAEGPLQIIDSKIISNHALTGGGGVFVGSSLIAGPVIISRTTVDNNVVTSSTAGSGGGGVATTRDATIDHSTISGNTARGGGGIEIRVGILTLVNSTVSGNTSLFAGGGISIDGRAVLRHTTIAFNTAGTTGGGIFRLADDPTTFENIIVSGNTAIANQNCLLDPGVVYQGQNLFGDGSCNPGAAPGIVADPLLGPLANNGGPTLTHKLLVSSPAIDAAPSCIVSDDQRGVARPLGPKCDLGSTEFTDYVATAATIDPSGTVNQSTGVAVVSGTHTCAISTPLTLRVTVKQKNRARRIPTEIVGTADVSVTCDAKAAWAAAVPPLTGAFSNSPVSVTVQSLNQPAWVAPISVTAASVTMAWSRR